MICDSVVQDLVSIAQVLLKPDKKKLKTHFTLCTWPQGGFSVLMLSSVTISEAASIVSVPRSLQLS